jgi:polyadenylate-binding protein
VTEEELKAKFEEHGPLKNLVIMKDDKGKSRGFGFVNFENAEDAKKAVEELNGQQIKSKAIFAGRAQKKAEREEALRYGLSVFLMCRCCHCSCITEFW